MAQAMNTIEAMLEKSFGKLVVLSL